MNSSISRTHAFRAMAAALALTVAGMAQAQAPAMPTATPLRIIVPFAAGTPTDAIARTIGEGLARSMSRTVVVDNRPGAAGTIGTDAVVTAAPDGQTLLLTVNSPVTINPLLYTKLRHNPLKELAPVAMVASGGYLLVANPATGLRTVGDLIGAARVRPGKINYASYGPGSMSHMCAEIFQSMTQTRLYHVPYKSGSLTDILGGQVDIGFEPIGPAIGHVQSGKLEALGVTASRRIAVLPQVPAIAEALPGFDCIAWVGVLAPAATPAATRTALAEKILAIASTPEFARLMRDVGGLAAQPAGEAQFAQAIQEDHEKWARITRPLAIRLD